MLAMVVYVYRKELNVLAMSWRLNKWFLVLRWRNEGGLAEFVHRDTGIAFVMVPGGSFMMGCSQGTVDDDGLESPMHRVAVSQF
jgi:formylglycine-generating enzyme required for sulfatase activity